MNSWWLLLYIIIIIIIIIIWCKKTHTQKQRWLLTLKETNQNTQEVKNERFLIWTRQNKVLVHIKKHSFLTSCVFKLFDAVIYFLRHFVDVWVQDALFRYSVRLELCSRVMCSVCCSKLPEAFCYVLIDVLFLSSQVHVAQLSLWSVFSMPIFTLFSIFWVETKSVFCVRKENHFAQHCSSFGSFLV